MEWIKEKPVKPGWYWCKEGAQRISVVHVRRNVVVRNGLACQWVPPKCAGPAARKASWPLPENAEWAGPITEPKVKK